MTPEEYENLEVSVRRHLLSFDVVEKGDVGNKQTVYMTDIKGDGLLHQYSPFFRGIPEISKSLQGLENTAMPSWGEIVIQRDAETPLLHKPGVKIMSDDLLSGAWMICGQDILSRYGGDGLEESQYQTIFVGKMKYIKGIKDGEFTIDCSDRTSLLSTIYVNMAQITASEYPNAAESVIGRNKPIGFGYCQNVTPVLIDAVSYRYLFHDPTIVGYCSLDQVYDRGVPVSYTHNNDGTYTLAVRPTGQVTCTFKGAKLGVIATYQNTVGGIISGVLRAFAGYTDADIDITALTQFISDIPYEVGYFADEKTSITDLANALYSGIPAFYTFTRAGVFYTSEFRKPTGSGYSKILDMDGFTCSYDKDIVYKKRVRYDRNRSVISETQSGGTDLAWKAWMASEWREESYESATVKANYPLSIEAGKTADTCLINRSDANAVAQKWVALQGSQVIKGSFTTAPIRSAYEIGKEVWYRYPYFGMADGIYARITSLKENRSQDRVQIEVMAWV